MHSSSQGFKSKNEYDDDDDDDNAFTFSGFQTQDGRHGEYPDQEALKISGLCEKHTRGSRQLAYII